MLQDSGKRESMDNTGSDISFRAGQSKTSQECRIDEIKHSALVVPSTFRKGGIPNEADNPDSLLQ